MTSALFLFVLNWIGFGIYDHIDSYLDAKRPYTIKEHLIGAGTAIVLAPVTLILTIYYIYKDITK